MNLLKNKKIKVIFFDIGGVLAIENRKKHYPELVKIMKFDPFEFEKIRAKYANDFAKGKISENDYLKKFADKLKVDKNNLKSVWLKLAEKHFKIDKRAENLIKQLSKKYVVGTLTNVLPLHNYVRRKHKVYKHFKIKLLSCEQKMRKPEIKFYRLMIKRSGVKPNEILLIDDSEECLKPARKLGIKTILWNKKTIKKI